MVLNRENCGREGLASEGIKMITLFKQSDPGGV